MNHFIKRRGDKSAQTDCIYFFIDSFLYNLFGWNHHT
ncbi:Uncharacterised protein [Segatella copri]|nr:Uncharacterised protein [Segatella copri]